jgi:hypothetical protein
MHQHILKVYWLIDWCLFPLVNFFFSFIQCIFWRIWKLCGFKMYKWVTEKGCREVCIITDTNLWCVNNNETALEMLAVTSYFTACKFILKEFLCCFFYIQTIYVHFLKSLNLFVRVVEQLVENRDFSVSQRVLMYFTFWDNVCILCLSRNVKKSKTTCKLSKKSRNKRSSNRFLIVSSEKSALILLPFLPLLYMNQVPEKLYFGQWPYCILKKVSSQCNFTP